MAVEAISCADRCIRSEGGARAARQAAAIHKCGVSPMLSVPAGAAYSWQGTDTSATEKRKLKKQKLLRCSFGH